MLIHIGMPKAGSTTLQKHLFNRHPGITYVGLNPDGDIGPYTRDPALREFVYALYGKDSLEYDTEASRETLYRILSRYTDDTKSVVLSHEKLASRYSVADRAVKAGRLKALVPDAQVLLVIRAQHSILRSQYLDRPFDPRDERRVRPASFQQWLELNFKHYDKGFAASLDYFKLWELYTGLFGFKNVLVVLLEQLASEPGRTARTIAQFGGFDPALSEQLLEGRHENASTVKSSALSATARLRRYGLCQALCARDRRAVMSIIRRAFKGERAVSFTEECYQRIAGFYAPGNQKLAQAIGVDLEQFGYPMEL